MSGKLPRVAIVQSRTLLLFVCFFVSGDWMGRTATLADTPTAAKPNVILFLVDDMGWTDSTPYGSKYYDTPNIQRLAEQSMRFTDAYALPLCSPTRASIMTGQYSSRHGITSATGHLPPQPADFVFLPETAPANQPLRMPVSRNFLDQSHYTLPKALRDAGYRTGHFGKWHLGLTEPHWPENNGFDVAWHSQPSPGPPGFYFSPYGVVPSGTTVAKARAQRTYFGTITDGPDGEYITDRLTDEAVSFIESNQQQPFFLNLWQFGVHGPWGHKESYTAELAKNVDPTGRQDNPVMASMLKSVDDSLGRVMDKLDELGIADNTLLIFYSDNGGNTHSMTESDSKGGRANVESPSVASYRKWAGYKPPTNNSPLREGKGRIYEGGQRVPLMVRWPGKVKPGTTTDAVVGPIDLYPTILDALKIEKNPEQAIDGESLLPVLQQTGSLKRDAYFTWFPHLIPAVSVRQGDWKLIRRLQPHRDYPDMVELYNLRDDLSETSNLANAMPEKVASLQRLIDDFVKETGALYPQPNPAYKPSPVSTNAAPRDATFGLVPKFCNLTLMDDALRIEADGRTPFLGTVQVKANGPLTMSLRARSNKGGKGKIQWKLADQSEFPTEGQTVDFEIEANANWQDVTVAIPLKGQASTIRIYLPANAAPVDVQSIKFESTKTNAVVKQWDFAKR